MKLGRLPSWAPMAGFTFLGRIYLKSGCEALIPHESVHVEQQRRDGWRFYWRYVFRPKWRVRYEGEAYAVDVRSGLRTLDSVAADLASGLYLSPCSEAEAAAEIAMWLSIQEPT